MFCGACQINKITLINYTINKDQLCFILVNSCALCSIYLVSIFSAGVYIPDIPDNGAAMLCAMSRDDRHEDGGAGCGNVTGVTVLRKN